jgi:hypothetical protein
MQMMDDEQPHTIKNTLNKYTIKGLFFEHFQIFYLHSLLFLEPSATFILTFELISIVKMVNEIILENLNKD